MSSNVGLGAGVAGAALQVSPAEGGPVAFLGTFLLGWAFFTFTAQIAARYVLGAAPWRRAAVVGVVPAVVNVALIRYSAAHILLVALLADFAAVRVVYRLRYATTAIVTVFHIAVSIAISVPFALLVGLLTTAPG